MSVEVSDHCLTSNSLRNTDCMCMAIANTNRAVGKKLVDYDFFYSSKHYITYYLNQQRKFQTEVS